MAESRNNSSDVGQDKSLLEFYFAAQSSEGVMSMEELCPSYLSLSQIEQRYRNFKPLASGGVKQLFKVHDAHSCRHVAMAMLRDEFAEDYYDPFIHEAWLTASLSHPNIVKVYDIGIIDEKKPFFTMDLKKGETLSAVIKQGERPLADLLEIFIKVCDAVAYAHSQGVLHLDLKPANVQVEEFGEVVVCDWGLGQLFKNGKESAHTTLDPDIINNVTLSGAVRGTPGFMAPEQIDPEPELTPQADIYALGCLLYYMLTGHKPFSGSPESILEKTKTGSFVPPRRPAGVAKAAIKAMALRPGDRYDSVLELQQDIRRYLANYPTSAENANVFKKMLLFYKRNNIRCLIAFVSLVAISALTVFFARALGRTMAKFEQEHQLAVHHEQRYIEEKEYSRQTESAYLDAAEVLAERYLREGLFDRPALSLRKAESIIQEALVIAPENSQLIYRQAMIHFIRLNFNEVHRLLKPNLTDYIVMAKLLPELIPLQPTDATRPPPVNDFVNIINTMRRGSTDKSLLVGQMVAFDHVRRGTRIRYAPIVESALHYYNPDWSNQILDYDVASRKLIFGGDQLTLTKAVDWHQTGLLGYLPIQTLELRVTNPFNLSEIDYLVLDELDLSGSVKLDLAPLAGFNNLARLSLPKGLYTESEISALPETISVALID